MSLVFICNIAQIPVTGIKITSLW